MDLYNAWIDILQDEETNVCDKICLVCEFPITVIRKMTVAVPCEGYYCRAMVATSVVLSPFWFYFYLFKQHGINVFSGDTLAFGIIHLLIICLVVGLGTLRYAPSGWR